MAQSESSTGSERTTRTAGARHRRRNLVLGGVAIGVVCGLAGGLIATAVGTSSASSGAGRLQSCSITTIANQNLPSVVTISARGANGGGTGSGEIIRSDGYILTNNHVIAPAANGGSITVRFDDGDETSAKIVGRDPPTDVAVIKVTGQGDLRPIPMGSSSAVVVGEPVIVLGAPLGLSTTVTSGIISATDRTVAVPGESSQAALLIDALQTDAPINPGNSGGALLNCNGQFVGMPTAGATVPSTSGASSAGSVGLGFAIPSDQASQAADEIISTGHVTHSYIGLQAVPIPPNAVHTSGAATGLIVTAVDASGPAQAAGLRRGDVVTTIDGQPARTTEQLVAVTLSKKPGDTVTLGFERNGERRTARVTLATLP